MEWRVLGITELEVQRGLDQITAMGFRVHFSTINMKQMFILTLCDAH